jgi:hypothetical protein
MSVSTPPRSRVQDVVIVRLVSLEFLERYWDDSDLKQLMAPRWSLAADADIGAKTVHESVAQVANGNYDAIVDFCWHFLGLARLADREAGQQEDQSWRAQLRLRGWPLPQRTYVTIDNRDVVDVIRKASKNIDWSVLYGNVCVRMPTRGVVVSDWPPRLQQPPRFIARAPGMRKAITTGPVVLRNARATKHWSD